MSVGGGLAGGGTTGADATVTLPFRTHAGSAANYPNGDFGSALVREGVYEHEPVTIRVTNP